MIKRSAKNDIEEDDDKNDDYDGYSADDCDNGIIEDGINNYDADDDNDNDGGNSDNGGGYNNDNDGGNSDNGCGYNNDSDGGDQVGDDGCVKANGGETDCGGVENKIDCGDNVDDDGVHSNGDDRVDHWGDVDTNGGVDNNCDVCREKMTLGKLIIEYSNFAFSVMKDILNVGRNPLSSLFDYLAKPFINTICSSSGSKYDTDIKVGQGLNTKEERFWRRKMLLQFHGSKIFDDDDEDYTTWIIKLIA